MILLIEKWTGNLSFINTAKHDPCQSAALAAKILDSKQQQQQQSDSKDLIMDWEKRQKCENIQIRCNTSWS